MTFKRHKDSPIKNHHSDVSIMTSYLFIINCLLFILAITTRADSQYNPPHFINRPTPLQAVVPTKASAGTVVYKLQARSDNPTGHNNIHYRLTLDRSQGRFEVDSRSGEVRTKLNDPFFADKEYVLYVRAEDHSRFPSGPNYPSTEETKLSIMGGRRPPQFYLEKYSISIKEDTKRDTEVLEIKAKSFSDREIRYTLESKGKGAGTFTIDPSSGKIKLVKEVDYEDIRQPRSYTLRVNASEDSGGFTSTTDVTIGILDVNDNAPRFELPDYQVYNVLEDVKIGTKITTISASDADSGENGKIEYSLDRNEFTIDSRGNILTSRRLDADVNNTYVLTVKATDKGNPPLTGTAIVRIYTENTNDEAPKFSQDVYTPNVDENAGPRTLVTTVVASDRDGDNVIFGFAPSTKTSLFQIEERTGVIRLSNNVVKLDRDKYELNVTAKDDGKCCEGKGNNIIHTSTALVVVFITDVNDQKPTFEDCANYNPTVREGVTFIAPVTTVKATDNDKGRNGQVRYSIVQQHNQKRSKFSIDEITGEIKTNKVFDREGEDGRFVSVTVKAVDLGSPPLEGVCSFKVEILDDNDNPPLFDRQEYHENVRQDMSIGSHIARVSASDEDIDVNGAISYYLAPSSRREDLDFFEISRETGWITLKKPLERESYHLKAIARDMAPPFHNATVDVVIDVVDRTNSPPQWDQPVYVKRVRENERQSSRIISIKASSGIKDNNNVFYTILKGSTEQTNKFSTFYLETRKEGQYSYADIILNYNLDYEKLAHYNLTVRAENDGLQQLASECSVNIEVEDVNDEIPLFVEREQQTVLESMPPGTRVTQVQAIDKDGTSPNNLVTYQIEGQDGEKNFTIDRNTGEIFTKVEFDREEKQNYALVIRATDGAPSDRPGSEGKPNSVTTKIRIGIGDKNDNSPYFESSLYEAEVNEDEDNGHVLITVTAKDKDESSKLRYEIVKGNIGGGAFAVNNETGTIYVAGPLDYELRKEYKLVLVASDNLNENYTNVVIKVKDSLNESNTTIHVRVKDVNDLPPKFSQNNYSVTIEENSKDRQPILQVSATDGDRDRPQNIVYFLADQGINDKNEKNDKFFSINQQTGEIFVEKPLDRDAPHGRPVWRFTVYAEDEGGHNGLVGYADVVVNLRDINDNAPFFPNSVYIGNVSERGLPDVPVMTMQAIDYDDPNEGRNAKLSYAISQNAHSAYDNQPLFRIEEDSGIIYTTVGNLDRESIPEYTLKISATDGGGKEGYAQAIIKVKDVNDMPPTFYRKDLSVEVDETLNNNIPETPIAVIQVVDADSLESNRFTYRVTGGEGSEKFNMVTNSDGTGSLKIAKPLDYEDQSQRTFKISIQVHDGGEIDGVAHTDEAQVTIKLRDINDNSPEFEKPTIEVSVREDAPKGTQLATFKAHDADQQFKSVVTYSIDRSTNKKKQFFIDPMKGVVTIQRPLDREEQSRMSVKILATDDGVPQRTSVATLTVILEDVNDNPPRFLKDYVAIVPENSPPGKIIEIQAADSDDRAAGNGPPFSFWLDTSAPQYIKDRFEVTHDGNGEGIAHVSTKQVFDRELIKEYQVPIVIKDSGSPHPLQATSYLTVIVGDINDNKMYPGSKTIFVYNYKGQYKNIPIGRVHVEDQDDWDLHDKKFHWENNMPHPNFHLDQSNGTIFMKNVTEGSYLLRFYVSDHKFTQDVTANVTIIVKNLPDEAVYNSGSIRLSGITDEDFIRVWDWKSQTQIKSKYDRLRETLSGILREDTSNIDIFSVSTRYRKGRIPETDVRFAAHGSPYHKSTFLNGYVAINRRAIERELGLNITMVGIDECMTESSPCDGSCTNTLKVEPYPHVVNANRTSLVGVFTRVVAECECAARRLDEIDGCNSQPPFCLNGGKCSMQGRIATCECPPGFTGPQCQTTSRTFGGRGWAWFPPLEQCENSHLSLEFLTESSNGILFYNGPVDVPETGVAINPDFISLELLEGRPKLIVDFGSGTSEIIINTLKELNDGEWHRVDIFWTREDIRLLIDHCRDAKIEEDLERPTMNRSMCEQKALIKPYNEFLNVNSPLQLGGVFHREIEKHFPLWRHKHTREGFKGCIRNLVHNSRTYDLGSPGGSVDSMNGCSISEERCQSNSLTSTCEHGQCIGDYKSASCLCDPGWTGSHCDIETQVKMFQHSSFIRYALSFDPNPYITDIQLRFRTRQKSGELIRIIGKHTREYCVLEIKDRRLRFRYHLDQIHPSKEFELTLPEYIVSDGFWHTVRVIRHGSTATMEVDGGSGKKFNEITDYVDLHQLLVVNKQSIIVGGEANLMGPAYYVENGLHDSCVTDIRIDQKHLPMENGSENAVVTESKAVIDGCISVNSCNKNQNTCAPPFVCTDLWNYHECTCPAGWVATEDGGCTDDNECSSEPCNNGGTCINLDNGQGFLCVCQNGFAGDICHLPVQEKMILVANSTYAIVFFIIVNVIGLEKKETVPVTCGDRDECWYLSCGLGGVCNNIEHGGGFYCECPTMFEELKTCTNCTCDNLLIDSQSVLQISSRAIAVIVFICMLMILLIIVVFFVMRRGSIDQKYGASDPDDDVRENIISYDDEGGGEDDMHAFDITPLRIPVDSSGTMISSRSKQNIFNKPGILKDLRKGTTYDGDGTYGTDPMVAGGQFLDPGVRLIDNDERDAASRALDDLRNYAYEGCGSTAGSLSSLASIGRADDEAQDFEYLTRWGPRFQNLANLYLHNDQYDPQNHEQQPQQ